MCDEEARDLVQRQKSSAMTILIMQDLLIMQIPVKHRKNVTDRVHTETKL